MSVMSSAKLSAQIRSIKTNSKKVREQIQEALISCAYYAYKDGQVTPFNQLLEAVGTATRIKGLTAWAELHGCVLVRNEKFVLNKSARAESDVKDEADFAEYEKDMRASPMWFDIVPKEATVSIFDASAYLSNVITKLEKEGQTDAAKYIADAVESFNKAQAIKQLALESLGEAPV